MALSFNEEVRLLSMADIMEPLPEEEIEDLAREHFDSRLEGGEILFTPQEHGERLYIVKEGRVRIYETNPEGQEITLAIADEGKMFGEMALTAQQVREVYARALEPSTVFSLRREDLESLVLEHPKVGLRLIERLGERVRELETRLRDVSLKQVPARLASHIARLAEREGVMTDEGYTMIPTRYTHEQLGTMIGANRVAVTRAFAELREAGAVEQRRRTIYIKDLQALTEAAGEERHRGEAG